MNRQKNIKANVAKPVMFRRRMVLPFVLALLFAVQGILINSHVHLPVVPLSHSAVTQRAEHHKTGFPDPDAACALCLAAALIGTYAPPPVVLLPVPMEFVLLERAYFVPRPAIPAHHRAWQSRAPPSTDHRSL